jgi:predicted membrane channel-forming protein YqfA (hemolysin III family)
VELKVEYKGGEMKQRFGIVLMVLAVALPVMTAAMIYLGLSDKTLVQGLVLFFIGAIIYICANDKKPEERKQQCKQ